MKGRQRQGAGTKRWRWDGQACGPSAPGLQLKLGEGDPEGQ